MKVTEHLKQAKCKLISVEIIPPKRGANIADFHRAVESIQPFCIPFVNVTSHAAEVEWQEQRDGTYRRRVKRKSPGTFGLCALLKYKYNIDPVPHLLCRGFSHEETEDALIELNYLGIDNVLAIRGDNKPRPVVPSHRTVNQYASELTEQVVKMNQGVYQDPDLFDAAKTNFCVGVACYPEKHFESPNIAFDLDVLLRKQRAGADYAVTQMFFNNERFFEFEKRARDIGVTIPIIPGLKILTTKRQLTSIPSSFFIEIPEGPTSNMLASTGRKSAREVGVDWAFRQVMELFERGAPCVHFYVMQNTTPFVTLMERLQKEF
ncbi:MAG: methylenetetrahydrofolate reductase [Deltaproteobacteria bacterium]|nr:methylenetetrahydrofolate reductase [Deltaproteobacteria bacterium]